MKSDRFIFPVPPKSGDFGVFSEDAAVPGPMDGVRREVVISTGNIDMIHEMNYLMKSFWKKHGRKPDGFLLGWKAALCLQAQAGGGLDTHWQGVPVFSSWMVMPWGRSVLNVAESNSLLQYLVDGEFPIEE